MTRPQDRTTASPRFNSGMVRWFSIALSLAGAVTLATSASAGAHVHGSICQPSSINDVNRLKDISANLLGLVNNGTAQFVVTCPSPIDHDVGASLQWSTMVNDGNAGAEVSCFGGTLDIAGSIVGSTASAGSGIANTGKRQLLYSFSAPASSADYSYMTNCSLPGFSSSASAIHTVRVF